MEPHFIGWIFSGENISSKKFVTFAEARRFGANKKEVSKIVKRLPDGTEVLIYSK